MTEVRLHQLKKAINRANDEYYINDNPTLTDSQYDLLYAELKAIEREYPHLITEDSPTQKVGSTKKDNRFKKVEHVRPMISLENKYSDDEITAWLNSRCKDLGVTSIATYSEPKIDGLALSLIFQDGLLIRAATRGRDGIGDDILNSALQINEIPKRLNTQTPPKEIEVRGEIYFTKSAFLKVKEQVLVQEKKELKNARNAAAGTVRNLDSSVVKERQPQFFAYSAQSSDEEFATSYPDHSERMKKLQEFGFTINPLAKKSESVEELIKHTNSFYEIMNDYDVPCDGWVIKIDNIPQQEALGLTAKTPRWAIAAKPKEEEYSTKFHKLTLQTSRSGIVTPVAEVEPIDIDDSTITRATLHNYDEIRKLNVAVGDYIFIKKGGGVIPDITGVDPSRSAENRVEISPPEHCPSCGGRVEQVNDEVAYRCTNTYDCPAQQIEKIIYFASKGCIEIRDVGEVAIENLYELKLISKPIDLFNLTEAELSQLPGYKAKKINNALEGIESAKKAKLVNFITAIGIKGVGKEKARILANHFKTPEAFKEARFSEICNLTDFSDVLAGNVIDYFKNEANIIQYNQLIDVLNISHENSGGNEFSGLSFVVTGTFNAVERKKIEAHIKDNGGKVTSPSGKTNYLILGEDGGGKADKVEKLNANGASIVIMGEIEALAFLKIT